MDIYLKDLFSEVENEKDNFRIHFARYNQYNRPLDVFMRSREEWQHWTEYRPNGKDCFPVDYVITLIDFYPEYDTWLFGGIFKIENRSGVSYQISLTDKYSGYIGRLKILYRYTDRTTRTKIHDFLSKMVVKELLPVTYDVLTFPGYKNVDISYASLANIYAKDSTEWKIALKTVKGIYLIADIKSGKKYVGSATGANGFWGRWSDYIENGHGGDVDLRKLVNEHGMDYVKKNYKFTILEFAGAYESDEVIINRESYWKRVLMSRMETAGYNKN